MEEEEKIQFIEKKMIIDIEKCKKKIGETSLNCWGKKIKLSTLKSLKTVKTEGKIKIFLQTCKAETICHQQTNTAEMLGSPLMKETREKSGLTKRNEDIINRYLRKKTFSPYLKFFL